jgi:SAM-dependent methyltransferase
VVSDHAWEEVAGREPTSWYLDPLVAAQKRVLNAELVRKALDGPVRLALKTDTFEEACGDDSPMPDVRLLAGTWLAMDGAFGMVQRARQRMPALECLTADVRSLPFRAASLDLVFSNSTLDHFRTRPEFEAAVHEIARILRPRGKLIVTLDNSLNPTYWLLRALSKTRLAPFPLGYTASPSALRKVLDQAGFDIVTTGVMIHNPRVLSTLLYMLLRRLLGRRADKPIGAFLAAFQWLDWLPSRHVTACFITAAAVRRAETNGRYHG